MNKEYLKKLDVSEKTRCGEFFERYLKEGKLDESGLFRYKVAPKLKDRKLAFIGEFNREVLLAATPFYPTTILEICPFCKCVRDPTLLEPFLEKNRIIPMLTSEYNTFRKDFIDVILRYPHVSPYEYNCYRATMLLSKVEATGVCGHCIDKYYKKTAKFIENLNLPQTKKSALKWEFDHSFMAGLDPYLLPEADLLFMYERALKQKDFTKVNQITNTAEETHKLRSAQAFSAIPQLSGEEVGAVQKLISSYPELKVDYDITYVRKSVMSQLKLSYSPTMSVETYLDIVSQNERKIQKIVNDCIESGNPQDINFLSNLQREVEKINEEIREIESSKRAKFITLTTGFVAHNPSIIAGILFGAGVGLPIGLVGCGASAIGGGLIGGLVSKRGKVSTPKEAKELTKSFIELFEPAYEKFLAHSLSKNIKAIQVWRLQRALSTK